MSRVYPNWKLWRLWTSRTVCMCARAFKEIEIISETNFLGLLKDTV